MLDSRIRPLIDPISNKIGLVLSRAGLTANMVTIFGFLLGVVAFIALTQGHYAIACGLVILNRICDGLDGAVARHQGMSDFGGYLDIVLDFIFYALITLGFAIAEPEYAVAAAILIVSFVGTGSSFLAYAIIAEKRGMSTEIRGKKSLYYLGGLTEGTETIAVLLIMCIWPQYFPIFAYIFAFLCGVTTVTRIIWAYISFKE